MGWLHEISHFILAEKSMKCIKIAKTIPNLGKTMLYHGKINLENQIFKKFQNSPVFHQPTFLQGVGLKIVCTIAEDSSTASYIFILSIIGLLCSV